MTINKDILEIKKSGLFDEKWYFNKYQKNIGTEANLIEHYLKFGADAGFNPNSSFDTKGYLSLYKDVAKCGMNPLLHYIKRGRLEGRSPIGIEDKNTICVTDGMRSLPRFGGTEYGRIDHQIIFDAPVSIKDLSGLSLCVHIHLFHLEMADEFARYLNNIPHEFTLLISLCNENGVNWSEYFYSKIPKAKKCIVKNVENRGRDVAPWIVCFREEILNHDLFLHMHSKRSDYNASYNGWRRFLFHNNIGSINIVTTILNLFVEDKMLGLTYPPYFSALPNQPKWGANREISSQLVKRMGFGDVPEKCPNFPSGSFFWARVACLAPLLRLGLSHEDFDEENGQLDGTLGHAIERVIGILPQKVNMNTKCVGVDVSFNLINYWDDKRRLGCDFLGEKSTNKIVPPAPKREKLSNFKIAVFTCITGEFDEFVPSPLLEGGVDYYFFSDRESCPPNPFKFIPCRFIDINPRRTARFVKTHPHFHLHEYDFTVWVDGNIVPMDGILDYVELVLDHDADIGLIAHPIRTSYIDEAEECIRIGADDGSVITEQKKEYLKLGVPDVDLIETNIIVSRIKKPLTQKFYNLWWREICRYSYRDQISVNYALNESGVNYIFIMEKGLSVRDKHGFIVFSHSLKERHKLVNQLTNYLF